MDIGSRCAAQPRARGIGGPLLVIAAMVIALVAFGGSAQAATGTVTATVHLKNSTGGGVANGKVYTQYGQSGWSLLGTTDVSGNVTGTVPANHNRVRVTLGRGAQELTGVDFATQEPEFRTHKVTVLSSKTLKYQGYYQGFGTFEQGMELLPGTYTFSDTHDLSHRFNITVGDENLTAGALRLVDHAGNGLAGGTATYYFGGWRSLPGNTSADGTFVYTLPADAAAKPGSVSFSMTYQGSYGQQNAAQLATSNYTFTTTLASVRLVNSEGAPLDNGEVSYYGGAWRPVGVTSGGAASVELLPGPRSFAVVYKGTRQQLDGQPVSGTTSTVVFQTVKVHSESGTATQYYANGWKPFTQDMELLPGTYSFKVNGAQEQVTLVGGQANLIP